MLPNVSHLAFHKSVDLKRVSISSWGRSNMRPEDPCVVRRKRSGKTVQADCQTNESDNKGFTGSSPKGVAEFVPDIGIS